MRIGWVKFGGRGSVYAGNERLPAATTISEIDRAGTYIMAWFPLENRLTARLTAEHFPGEERIQLRVYYAEDPEGRLAQVTLNPGEAWVMPHRYDMWPADCRNTLSDIAHVKDATDIKMHLHAWSGLRVG